MVIKNPALSRRKKNSIFCVHHPFVNYCSTSFQGRSVTKWSGAAVLGCILAHCPLSHLLILQDSRQCVPHLQRHTPRGHLCKQGKLALVKSQGRGHQSSDWRLHNQDSTVISNWYASQNRRKLGRCSQHLRILIPSGNFWGTQDRASEALRAPAQEGCPSSCTLKETDVCH